MKKQTEKKLNKKLKKETSVEKNEKWELVRKNNSYGITLIALVITVIVLLILAGISISMLSGNNSILSRAGQAKTKTEYGKAQEALAMAYAEAVGDRYLNNSTTALESEVVQKLQNAGYTIGTQASGSAQIELSSTSVTLEEGGNTEEVTATIKADTKYMLVDGLYYPLTITNSTATLGTEGQTELTGSSISLSDLTLNTTGSITASLNTSTGVITITSESVISDNNKVELVNNETIYGTINVAVISVIGDYVNYNVPYADMYTNYGFTALDGWRILSRTQNAIDSSKYDIKLISTGVPAKLKYYYDSNPTTSTNANYEWWGTTEQVNSTYNLNLSSWSNSYSQYYAAYGLINNFTSIIFDYGTSQSTYNKGCWQSVAGKTSGTGADFIASGFINGTIGVHNLTLKELNKARRISDETDMTSTAITDGDNGLLYLRNLENENIVFGYTSSTSCFYWLGSPGSVYHMCSVKDDGDIDGYANYTIGVRPVVEIQGVTMTQDPTTKVWTITQ